MTDAALLACLALHKDHPSVLELGNGVPLAHFMIGVPKEDHYKQSCMTTMHMTSQAKKIITMATEVCNLIILFVGETCDVDRKVELRNISDELEATREEGIQLVDQGMKWLTAFRNAKVVGGELKCSEEEREGLNGLNALLRNGNFEARVRKGYDDVRDCVERMAAAGYRVIPERDGTGVSGFMTERR